VIRFLHGRYPILRFGPDHDVPGLTQ